MSDCYKSLRTNAFECAQTLLERRIASSLILTDRPESAENENKAITMIPTSKSFITSDVNLKVTLSKIPSNQCLKQN